MGKKSGKRQLNPVDAYRKKMRKRELQKNKEQRKKIREQMGKSAKIQKPQRKNQESFRAAAQQKAPYADELTGQPTRSAVEEEDFQFDERPKGIVTSKSITSMIPTSLLVRRETAKSTIQKKVAPPVFPERPKQYEMYPEKPKTVTSEPAMYPERPQPKDKNSDDAYNEFMKKMASLGAFEK